MENFEFLSPTKIIFGREAEKELNIPDDRFKEMAEKCKKAPDDTTGLYVKLREEDILNILKLAR